MINLAQGTWDLLFGWMTGKQCFLPEGCSVPLIGYLVYGGVLVVLLYLAYRLYNR